MPKAPFTPVQGSDKSLWLNRFSCRLPRYAAQLGIKGPEAAQLAAQFHAKSLKPPTNPPTP